MQTSPSRGTFMGQPPSSKRLNGGRGNTRAFQRHTGITSDLTENSDYPDLGYQELGRSRGARLKTGSPVPSAA